MALFEEQITDTLETGAPPIKYEGDEGPQDPRQEAMLAQLKEEYMQYVFERRELEEPIMSFEEWYQMTYKASQMGAQAPQEEMMSEEMMMREPAAYGGIMDTESGRRMYGIGSFFKKITKPFKKVGKKLVGGIKNIAKSPLGKAALLYAGTAGLGALAGGATGTGFTKAALTPSGIMSNFGKKKFLSDVGTKLFKNKAGNLSLAKLGIGAASALPLLGIGTQKQQEQLPDAGGKFDFDYDDEIIKGARKAAMSKDIDQIKAFNEKYGTDLVEDIDVYQGAADGGRIGFALGSKADFAIEDVMTGGVEDELGGITGIMRQADLQRKGNIGQFYAADGGMPMMASAPDPMDERNSMMENLAMEYFGKPLRLLNEQEIIQIEEMMDNMDPYGSKPMPQPDRMMAREGGIMDLGGMEKDYRETGGFVDIGAEEKADDVPARLSVNEFVMTADAVRGAGDGDIDLGAERMEDTMKQLEQQGKRNQGASDMFEVSERLSEVI